jgi:hypothetical protein
MSHRLIRMILGAALLVLPLLVGMGIGVYVYF